MDPSLLIFPAVALMIGAAAFQAWRKSARRIAAIAALAQRQGMSLRVGRGRLGGVTDMSMQAAGDGLTLVIRPGARKGGGPLPPGGLVLSLPEPRLAGGLAVFAGRRVPGMDRALATLAGALDTPVTARLGAGVAGAVMGGQIGQLQDFPSREFPGLMILGTVDPALFFDLAGIERMLTGLPQGRRGDPPPLLMIGEGGLVLRLTPAITAPETLTRIIQSLRDGAVRLHGDRPAPL